jgi:hypothetical protein
MKKLFIVFAALCLAVPAMAADWNFYGSARFATFYTDDFDPDVAGEDSVTNLLWDQQGNSRIGANVKVNDEIGGRFEMSDSFGNLRLLYGTYTFGSGYTFQIGQDYTPSSSYFYSNSVLDDDGDLLGVGVLRRPGSHGAAEAGWDETGGDQAEHPGVAGGLETETMLPKLEASYGYKADNFFVDVFGGYQTYEVRNRAGADFDIDSYVLGIGGGVNFGPVYFKAGVTWARTMATTAPTTRVAFDPRPWSTLVAL